MSESEYPDFPTVRQYREYMEYIWRCVSALPCIYIYIYWCLCQCVVNIIFLHIWVCPIFFYLSHLPLHPSPQPPPTRRTIEHAGDCLPGWIAFECDIRCMRNEPNTKYVHTWRIWRSMDGYRRHIHVHVRLDCPLCVYCIHNIKEWAMDTVIFIQHFLCKCNSVYMHLPCRI